MNMRAASLVALIAVAGCDSTGPDASGFVQVLLTDAPSDYLEEAEVCISQVYLQGGEGEDAGRTVLWEMDTDPQCFDLLLLQGVTATLTDDGGVEVPAGTYAQLRLIVESASVVPKEGYMFSDGTMEADLFIPSGAQTGIKVQLLNSVFVEPTELTEITVDADVNKNFQIQGDPDSPDGIMGVLFTPHLEELPEA
jgi:hypothetical protein